MKRPTALTDEEKRVVKALLADGMRNQDIHALINYERAATVNFGRITGVKKNSKIAPASAEEVAFFRRKKFSFDPVTGLNVYGDERLIRGREAMIFAVTIFNSGGYRFKTEIFSILANIAWTYLMHEYYGRKGIQPLNADGTAFGLSYMLSRPDCPLSKGIKNNLLALKAIRDEAEHKMLGRSDVKWLPLFQACCLNFDKTLVNWFGSRVSLQGELSVALQFGKLELEQAAQISAYDIPPNITALDALLKKDMKEEDLDDLEYQFRVVYTFDSASKGKAHIHFLSPEFRGRKDRSERPSEVQDCRRTVPLQTRRCLQACAEGQRKALFCERPYKRLAETQNKAPKWVKVAREDKPGFLHLSSRSSRLHLQR